MRAIAALAGVMAFGLMACENTGSKIASDRPVDAKFSMSDILADGGEPLGDEALHEMFVGKTIDHVHRKNGKVGIVTNNADGSRIVVWDGKTYSNTSYQIRDGKRCDISISDGKEYCMTVIAYRDTYFLCDPRHDRQCVWEVKP